MLETIYSGYLYLDASHLNGDRLELRLVPADFDLDTVESVSRIIVGNIENPGDTERKIGLLQEYVVYDIEADASHLSVWCEEFETPLEFAGTVAWTKEAYIASDYVGRIRVLEKQSAQNWDETRALADRIDKSLAFIDRALDRLHRRLGFAASEDSQVEQKIRLLKSVERQLREE